MSDIVYGSVTIKQSRVNANTDGGSFKYSVVTALSNPINFKSDAVIEQHPEAMFLFEYDEFGKESYVRLCTVNDFFRYRAFIPDPADSDGYFRKADARRDFNSPEEALSYSRTLYESLNNLYLTLSDYEQTFTNAVETGVLPNLSSSTLYLTIQEYLTLKDSQTEIENKLSELNNKKDAYTDASSLLYPLKTLIEDQSLNSTIVSISNEFTILAGNLSDIYDKVKGSAGLDKKFEDLHNTMGRINDLTLLSPSSIRSLWDSLKTYLSGYPSQQLLDMEALFSSLSTTFSTYYNPRFSDILTTLSDVSVKVSYSNTKAEEAKTDFNSKSTELNQFIIISKQLLQQFDNNLISIESELTEYNKQLQDNIKARQIVSAKLVELAPNIDLTDPLTIYNHRIFTWIDQ